MKERVQRRAQTVKQTLFNAQRNENIVVSYSSEVRLLEKTF